MKEPMEHHTIKFNFNGSYKKFEIMHNLKEQRLDIEAAFDNWSARLTSESKATEWQFCNYVKSKDSAIKCMPKYVYDRLKK